jgi:hypothetical protein
MPDIGGASACDEDGDRDYKEKANLALGHRAPDFPAPPPSSDTLVSVANSFGTFQTISSSRARIFSGSEIIIGTATLPAAKRSFRSLWVIYAGAKMALHG